jgi:hypothetical protein
MLLKNYDTQLGLVNGARGSVIRFEKNNSGKNIKYFPVYPVVKFLTQNGQHEEEQCLSFYFIFLFYFFFILLFMLIFI